MNLSDSERIASVLESAGYEFSDKKDVDLLVVNMCSVRQSAVDRIFGLKSKISKLKDKNSKIKTVLTGCILKKNKKKLSEIFDYIISIENIKKLPQIISNSPSQHFQSFSSQSFPLITHGRELLEEKNCLNFFKINPKYQKNFSANVPIMTGCNNFCSYCVVPYTRNREISRPAKEIIAEIKKLVKNEYKEIWLLGQNVNSYNCKTTKNIKNKDVPYFRDRGNKEHLYEVIDFSKLLKMINKIDGNFWIRFTSSHPKDFSDSLIKTLAKCEKFAHYLNLPVQSGDNQILKKMNRNYTVEKYKDIITKLRNEMPDISISTDIIVGFPGETKKQFQNTVNLFKEIKFDMAYISQYSPRPKTAAEKIKDNISKQEKKLREITLNKTLEKTALENNKKLIGKKSKVLIDKKINNYLMGKNNQYKTLKIKSDKNLVGKFVEVKITDAEPWGLKAKIEKF